ncbi:DEAD/DEAH box helicase [Neptunomonas qingdaonensis]|uniref:Superfamily II DNA or RNA helicase, SNF2 family n=1 Tax=Neptunomonas qingdaonensis TaxID=1045558 RepID=A0A1I2QRJ0_9GAMM|nr:DEAD/DEAH box helicase [Neptunomonas qingdaonensis]SFG29889.1 Superfamily II DNA or RNA helicase, SNF2 family [Neptunomonas qingdaonensis]
MTKKAELNWVRSNKQFIFTLVYQGHTVPVDEWGLFDIVHATGSANISCLFRELEQGSAYRTAEEQIICEDQFIASLTEVEIMHLGLSSPSQCRLQIKGQGLISQPGFTLQYKLLRSDGRPYMGVKRNGVVLEAGGKELLILDPIYTLIEKIDAYRISPAEDLDERFVRWGEVQELLPEETVIEGRLSHITICRADRITLDVKPSGRFEPVLIKPNADKDLDIQGQSDVENAIPTAKQKEFEKQFSNRQQVRSNYAVGGGTYVVLPPRVVNVLKVIRHYQTQDRDRRLAFIANPHQFINEALQEGVSQDEDLDSLFVETPEFVSQRIECIGVWEPKICAYKVERNGDWLPEDGERLFIPLGDLLIQLSVIDAKKLLIIIAEALDAEVPVIVFNEQKIPANLEIKNQLIHFLKPFEELKEEKAPGTVIAPILKDNIEDVEFNVLTSSPRAGLSLEPELLKTKPLYPYQKLGVSWLADHWSVGSLGALLADDMGLGKTLQALTFLALLQESMRAGKTPNKPVLIVAPSGLLKNWMDEEQMHLHRPGLGTLFEAYGPNLRTFAKRSMIERNSIVSQAGWVMTTYETLRDKINYFISIEWAVVVFDEAQKIKNPSSRNTEMAKSLSSDFTLIVTGTPVENELKDLWCLIDTAQPGLFGSLREFHNRYVVPAESDPTEARALKNILVEQTKPALMMRRMKEDHLEGLTAKYLHDMPIPMPKLQAEAYEGIIKDGQRLRGTPGGMLKIIQQMRRASLVAENFDENGINDGVIRRSARLSGVIDLLDSISKKNEKVLIFVEQLDVQEHLSTYLQQRFQLPKRPMTINGKIDGVTRKKYVDVFQTTRLGEFDVMLLSPKAGGVGLTITAANHVIHLSRWWNPAVEDQSTDRVFRIGQKKPVHVYFPMAIHPTYQQRSFDANLHRLLTAKRELSHNALLSGSATNEEIKQLFEDSLEEG